jgi:hypothetical protein
VIIWLDAQLSPELAGWMEATFGTQCRHVRDLGLPVPKTRKYSNKPAECIALQHRRIIVILRNQSDCGGMVFGEQEPGGRT